MPRLSVSLIANGRYWKAGEEIPLEQLPKFAAEYIVDENNGAPLQPLPLHRKDEAAPVVGKADQQRHRTAVPLRHRRRRNRFDRAPSKNKDANCL